MKIAVVGGHLSPALAVIDALPKEHQVIFLGRRYALEGDSSDSLEYQEIARRNIPFFDIKTGRISRSFTRHTIPAFIKVPFGFYQAMRYLQKEKPNVVVSFGGYLSVPVGYAAKLLGIPLIIHEQTLEAGLANKLLGKIADIVCISWESSKKYFPKGKTVLTGNPIKTFPISNFKFPISRNAKLPLIYITGGSTGSHAINALVLNSLFELVQHFRVIHQTGDAKFYNDFAKLTQKKETLPKEYQNRYLIRKFIPANEIGSIFSHADLVVSRAGMNTVTELMYFGVPALLIPLPHGQKEEQMKNARLLQSIGLAEILPQSEAKSETFLRLLFQMCDKRKKYHDNSKKAKALLKTDAASRIVNVLSYVVKKKNS